MDANAAVLLHFMLIMYTLLFAAQVEPVIFLDVSSLASIPPNFSQ